MTNGLIKLGKNKINNALCYKLFVTGAHKTIHNSFTKHSAASYNYSRILVEKRVIWCSLQTTKIRTRVCVLCRPNRNAIKNKTLVSGGEKKTKRIIIILWKISFGTLRSDSINEKKRKKKKTNKTKQNRRINVVNSSFPSFRSVLSEFFFFSVDFRTQQYDRATCTRVICGTCARKSNPRVILRPQMPVERVLITRTLRTAA